MSNNVVELMLLDAVITGDNAEESSNVDLKDVCLGVLRSYFYTNLALEVGRITDEALECLQGGGANLA